MPGRLALRWSVETSGFDVERWLESGGEAEPTVDAYLVAKRTERYPALVLATPARPEGVSDDG